MQLRTMQLARRFFFLLFFPAAAFAQTTYTCPANQYVATQLVNTGQSCLALPAGRLVNTETAGAGGVTVNTFVSADTSAPTKFITAVSGSCGSGVALATAASGATFTLSGYEGTVQVTADSGGIIAGHLIVGSTVTPGLAMDSGTTTSLSVSELTTVCGTALNTVAGGALVTMNPRSRGSFGHKIDNIGGTSLAGLATGLLKITTGTGVASSVAAPAGSVVGTTDTQPLTNKAITSSTVDGTAVGSTTPAAGTFTAGAVHELMGAGSAPSVVQGSAMGTSPTCCTVTGSDLGGQIGFTTGTAPPAAGTLLTVTFATALGAAPRNIMLNSGNSNALSAVTKFVASAGGYSTTGFTITYGAGGALTASTVYVLGYLVIK